MSKQPENIRQFFQSDRAVLLACIGLALIFWILIKLTESYRSAYTFQLTYEIPDSLYFAQRPPATINVNVEGRGWDLLRFHRGGVADSIVFEVDQNSTSISGNYLRGQITELIGNEVRLMDLSRDYIPLQLDQAASKKVEILLNGEPIFADNHQLKDSIRIVPDSIQISGAASVLANITSWPTVALKTEPLRADHQQLIKVGEPPSNQNIRLGREAVELMISVEEFTEKRLFVPIEVINAPDSVKLNIQEAKVIAKVGLSKYNDLTAADIRLVVDLSDVRPNRQLNTAPISVEAQPNYIQNLRLTDHSVEFFFVRQNNGLPQ